MSAPKELTNIKQHDELLKIEKVNCNNINQVTISAVKSPSSTNYKQPSIIFTPGKDIVNNAVKSLVEGFPSAPKKVVENEKARGIVSPAWDGDFRTFTQNVIPCPMCSFPVRESGCGYCH